VKWNELYFSSADDLKTVNVHKEFGRIGIVWNLYTEECSELRPELVTMYLIYIFVMALSFNKWIISLYLV